MPAPILALAVCLFSQSPAPVTLDSARQLFLDDYLVASSEGVTRRLHPLVKWAENPVLQGDQPWENNVAILYGSVIKEKDKYRMWYYAGGNTGYAESPDGLSWTKPKLGLIGVDEQDTNLLLHRGAAKGQPGFMPNFYEVFGVHRDDRDSDPSRRYKMGFLSIDRNYKGPREDPFHRGQRRGLGVAASADGIHWRLLDNWATESICDGGTYWTFDPKTNRYLLYGRTKFVDPKVSEAWASDGWGRRYFWGRSVARVESPDFLNWNVTQPAKAPVVMTADLKDPPGTEIYSMQVFSHESIYIGLVQIFHNQSDTCHLDIQLATSRDGVNFTRVCQGEPFLPVGPVGSWDRFNTSVANNGPIFDGEMLRFYYGGRTYRHGPYNGPDKGRPGGAIGFATARPDRFVSLEASFAGGRITTRPLLLTGGRLHLNAKSDFGRIVVEVLDAKGHAIARSVPVSADGLDVPVQWEEGNMAGVEGPVVLRISLSNALLFALWCDG